MLVTTVDDGITPVIADHLGDGVERAVDGGYRAYVVQLDTPGGLDVSIADRTVGWRRDGVRRQAGATGRTGAVDHHRGRRPRR